MNKASEPWFAALRVRWIRARYWGFHRWRQPSREIDWAFDLGHLRIARLTQPKEES